jgi:hypothetical protein
MALAALNLDLDRRPRSITGHRRTAPANFKDAEATGRRP